MNNFFIRFVLKNVVVFTGVNIEKEYSGFKLFKPTIGLKGKITLATIRRITKGKVLTTYCT